MRLAFAYMPGKVTDTLPWATPVVNKHARNKLINAIIIKLEDQNIDGTIFPLDNVKVFIYIRIVFILFFFVFLN